MHALDATGHDPDKYTSNHIHQPNIPSNHIVPKYPCWQTTLKYFLYTFQWALYVHPIHSARGDYPSIVRERVGVKSYDQGFPRSRLIELSREEVRYIRGTSDIFALNHYTTFLVHKNASVKYYESPSLHDDNGALLFQKDEWILGDSGYIKVKHVYVYKYVLFNNKY